MRQLIKRKLTLGQSYRIWWRLCISLHIFASTWADSRCFFHLFIAGEVMLIPSNSCYLVDLRRGLQLRTVCDSFSAQAAESALYASLASLALMALWQRCFFSWSFSMFFSHVSFAFPLWLVSEIRIDSVSLSEVILWQARPKEVPQACWCHRDSPSSGKEWCVSDVYCVYSEIRKFCQI